MFWERRLGNWVEGIRSHAALLLRLELWNGRQLDFGQQAPKVGIRVPHASALTYLLTAGCAYAFAQDWVSLYQVVCTKANRDAASLPWSRRYIYA
ncbi:MAG TPA: hypothetical protein VEB70_04740 [Noviherbaspirillum sp.]|nr:hypothetical protein [Noviherbaspirillum sp.]